MTLEDKARQNIDLQLQQCGREVQGVADMNIMAGLGVAVREFPLTSGFAPEAVLRAETLVTNVQQLVEDNKDEIEAISTLYGRAYAVGLRYGQVKELARRQSIKPFHIDESQPQSLLRLPQAFSHSFTDEGIDVWRGGDFFQHEYLSRKHSTRRISLST